MKAVAVTLGVAAVGGGAVWLVARHIEAAESLAAEANALRQREATLRVAAEERAQQEARLRVAAEAREQRGARLLAAAEAELRCELDGKTYEWLSEASEAERQVYWALCAKHSVKPCVLQPQAHFKADARSPGVSEGGGCEPGVDRQVASGAAPA